MKKVFKIIIWMIVFSGIIYALYFVSKRQSEIRCSEFSILIDFNHSEPLISKKDITNELSTIIDTIKGKYISEIPIKKMEDVLSKNPFIENADVFSALGGKIKIRILQKHPVIRITNTKNKSIYLDKNGSVMPAGKGSPARVLIANGYIYPPLENLVDTNIFHYRILKDVFEIANFIHQDKFLNAQIEQIFVTQNNEFELIPKLGNHVIEFGEINKMGEKFKKLIAFYKKGKYNDGLTKYKTLNLKYKNQIICTK